MRISELGRSQFYPTHVNRNAHCFEHAKQYALEAPVDITACGWTEADNAELKPSRALRDLLEAGVPVDNITMSSDACGSLPEFDADGALLRLVSGRPHEIWRQIVDAVQVEGLTLSEALATATVNPATVLQLPGKGVIAAGADADLLMVDSELNIQTVIAGGEVLMRDGVVCRRGTFE